MRWSTIHRVSALVLSGLVATASAGTGYLATNGAISCGTNEDPVITVDSFAVRYTQGTNEVTYNVSGTSLYNVEVLAHIIVKAYGQTVVDNYVDLCGDNITELCPVPSGYVQVTGTHVVPDEYTEAISTAAYNIPDLEGQVQIELYNASNPDQNLGCFMSDISNGKSTEVESVKYLTIALAAIALVISATSAASGSSGGGAGGGAGAGAGGGAGGASGGGGTAVMGASPAGGFHPPGFATFFTALQGIAVSGMYSVSYPSVYRSYASNMGWSAGMITWAGLQKSIDSFRASTGGNVTASNYTLLQNTRLIYQNYSEPLEAQDPSALIPATNATATVASAASSATSAAESALATADTDLMVSEKRFVEVIDWLVRRDNSTNGISVTTTNATSSSSTTAANSASESVVSVVGGLPAFTEKLDIPGTNTFMTLLIWWCIVVAVVLGSIFLLKITLEILRRRGKSKNVLNDFRQSYHYYLMTMMVRMVTLFYGLWVQYSLFEFKEGDGWGGKLLAGLTLGIFSLVLLLFSLRIIALSLRARKHEHGLERLFRHKPWIRKYGVFYDEYQVKYWWFFIPVLVVTFARNAFLGLGYGNGLLQIVGQLCVDFVLAAAMIYTRSFNTRMGNGINIAVQVVRVAALVLLLMFTKQVGLGSIASTAVGYVLLVLQSVLAIALILLIAAGASLGLMRAIRNSMSKEAEVRGRGDNADAESSLGSLTSDYAQYRDSIDGNQGSSTMSPDSDRLNEKEAYHVASASVESPHNTAGSHTGSHAASASTSTQGESIKSYHTTRDVVSPPLPPAVNDHEQQQQQQQQPLAVGQTQQQANDNRNSFMIRRVGSATVNDEVFDFLRNESPERAPRSPIDLMAPLPPLPDGSDDANREKHQARYFGRPESNPTRIDYERTPSL